MNVNDLNQIRKVIKEEVSAIVDERVSAIVDERVSLSEKKMTDIFDKKVTDSEKRMINVIDKRIAVSEKRIIGGVGKFIAEEVLPQIDEMASKSDIDRLERKLDRRISNIERIPVIAHELRSR